MGAVALRVPARDTGRAMSQENVEVVRGVRIPLAERETRRRRTLDERIVVRFPALSRLWAAAWARLPRHSRLRRVMLVRLIRQGCAAANRRDFELLLTGLDPVIELHRAQAFLDVGGTFHGHDGYLDAWRRALQSFPDLRLDPDELLDLGDRVLVTTKMSGHGAGSGVSVSEPRFQVFAFRRGLVVRQDDFVDRAEALEAVGLRE